MKFFAERVAGAEHFAIFFEALSIPPEKKLAAVAKFLDVSTKSLKLWLAGIRPPPRAAVIALFHECRYGLSATSTHSENGAALARQLATSLKRENFVRQLVIDTLRIELDTLKLRSADAARSPMNDPMYDRPKSHF